MFPTLALHCKIIVTAWTAAPFINGMAWHGLAWPGLAIERKFITPIAISISRIRRTAKWLQQVFVHFCRCFFISPYSIRTHYTMRLSFSWCRAVCYVQVQILSIVSSL